MKKLSFIAKHQAWLIAKHQAWLIAKHQAWLIAKHQAWLIAKHQAWLIAKHQALLISPKANQALLIFYLLSFIFLLSGCELPAGTEKMIPGRGPAEYSGELCIDPGQIGTTIILNDIAKPDETNIPFLGRQSPYVNCVGQGSCSGPTVANYVIVKENVKIEKIWPDDRTTRLVKQILSSDHPQYGAVKDHIYRATCNDWCAFIPPLPYGGTLFCDFIFLLHSDESLVEKETSPGVKELYPKDGAMFDILIRQGAEVPQYIGQPGKRKPLRCDLITPTPGATSSNWFFEGLSSKTLAQNDTFINIPDPADPATTARFIYHDEFELIKAKIREEAQGRKKITEVPFRGKDYEIYLNLPTIEPISNDYVYGVEKGVLQAILAQPDPFYPFTYLEFRRSREVKPFGKTLQLGTFPIPTSKGWWTLFANESKPAIYLYPEEPTKLTLKLNPAGKLTVSDPPYDPQTGWEVIAYPDGSLRRSDLRGGPTSQSYPYLFYEAELEKVWVEPKGFIVEGKNLVDFFNQTLPKLGLNNRETRDFINYWMTRLSENQPYYFIHFLDNDRIETLEPLEITGYGIRDTGENENHLSPITYHLSPITYHLSPTSIRLRAYFKPLDKPMEIESQTLPIPPQRQGFTLVEWGGILDD